MLEENWHFTSHVDVLVGKWRRDQQTHIPIEFWS
jgi:hypothetical protein